MREISERWRVVLVALGVGLVVAGCGAADRTPDTAPATDPPPTAGLPAESDLSPGWDESPDEALVPDEELSDAAARELLRTGAEVADAGDRCGADEVSAEFQGFDMAAGHRFTWLRVTNTSPRRCVVGGVPGFGARGEWGNTLQVAVSPDALDSGDEAGPVALTPGDAGRAMVEWSGSLAGAESEHASLVVVQLARGQVPLRLPAANVEQPDVPFDIGMDTSVHVQPFVPVER